MALVACFAVGAILSVGFCVWLYTKPGKKWLENF